MDEWRQAGGEQCRGVGCIYLCACRGVLSTPHPPPQAGCQSVSVHRTCLFVCLSPLCKVRSTAPLSAFLRPIHPSIHPILPRHTHSTGNNYCNRWLLGWLVTWLLPFLTPHVWVGGLSGLSVPPLPPSPACLRPASLPCGLVLACVGVLGECVGYSRLLWKQTYSSIKAISGRSSAQKLRRAQVRVGV